MISLDFSRNFLQLYDLNNVLGSSGADTMFGCQQGSCSSGKGLCGDHGECLPSLKTSSSVCACDPGWTGDRCLEGCFFFCGKIFLFFISYVNCFFSETKWKTFGSQSFVQYEMLNNGQPLPKNWAKLRVMFMSNAYESGELVRITDSYKTKYMNIEVRFFVPYFSVRLKFMI